jgi:hypothetical protein
LLLNRKEQQWRKASRDTAAVYVEVGCWIEVFSLVKAKLFGRVARSRVIATVKLITVYVASCLFLLFLHIFMLLCFLNYR